MPLRDDLLTPIAGSNPSGISLRYDPVTDKIKEARREDIDAPQGEWKTTLKVADHNQAIKLAGEAIAKRGKDLQLAVWLVDSHIRRDGFSMLAPCFQFLRELLEQFWDTIHPEIEDGDTETRSAPLEWLGSKLEEPVRGLPITSSKLTWVHYKESRTVGYEKDANTEEKKKTRQKLTADGKLTGEEFDAAVDGTQKAFLENIQTQIEEGLEALGALIDTCDEKFGEYSPSFIKSRTALEEIVQFVKTCVNKKGGPTPVAAPVAAAPPPPPPEPVAAAPAAAPAPVAAAAPAPAPVMVSGGIDPVDVEDAGVRLAAIARFLRKKDVYAIGPFLMLRGYRWGELRYNGPEIDTKMLVAPPAELRSELKERFLASDWDGVLATTEKAMELPCGRGWLDIQRYTVRALEAKGEWFKFVADGVRTELRGLLTDLPGLLNLTLLDDTPTANPDTMKWIQEEVLLPASGGGMLGDMSPAMYEAPPVYQAAPPPPPPPAAVVLNEAPPEMEQGESTEDKDAVDKALAAARGGRLDEAIQIVTEALSRERTGRGRYKRRMQLAHLFVAARKYKIAYPLLRELSAEIDRRQLEDWESGEVLAHPLVLLMQCMSVLGADETQRAELYDRICRLDPVQALNCQE